MRGWGMPRPGHYASADAAHANPEPNGYAHSGAYDSIEPDDYPRSFGYPDAGGIAQWDS